MPPIPHTGKQQVPVIKAILSLMQFTMAPETIQYLANAKGKIQIRMYSY